MGNKAMDKGIGMERWSGLYERGSWVELRGESARGIVKALRAGAAEVKKEEGGGSLHIIEEEWVAASGWLNRVAEKEGGKIEGRGLQILEDLKAESVRCRVLTEMGVEDSEFFEVWVPKVRRRAE